ncbi:hypothetical protein C8Q73DRAFT_792088 [Cubamyces lactineus]|nr:hypothetical protein C8Q73DRAFT_792088 [Cubamyces lactineus]
MHSIAYISEILTLICEYADYSTLALLARSSRVLHEPAIQVLWKLLPDLSPLIMCLPQDAWELEQGDTPLHVLSITRVLAPGDWTSFLKYSSLVRVLGHQFKNFNRYRLGGKRARYIEPSDDLWVTLCAHRPTPFLFPRLRTLSWVSLGLQNVHLPLFLLSLGEYVQEIRISQFLLEDEDTAKTLESAVRVIIDRFPRLRGLVLRPHRKNPNVSLSVYDPISNIASSLTSLVSLDCVGMSHPETALIALAQSKTLANLTLYLPDDATWPHVPPSFGTEPPFPSLISLRLQGTMRACVSFSKAVKFPTVRKVRIKLIRRSLPSESPEFFAAMPRQFCPEALEALHVSSMSSLDDLLSQTTLAANELRPLLAFKRMERLVLYAPCGLAINDALLLDMAASWPAMRELKLFCCSYCNCETHVNPTLAALPSLAFRCPELQELMIHLRATSWISREEFARDDRSGHIYAELKNMQSLCRLHTLYVGSSPIVAPDCVALFLSRIFPRLSKVEYCSRDYETLESRIEAWDTVSTFFATRAQ